MNQENSSADETFSALPGPRPGKGGAAKVWAAAVLAAVCVGGAGYWLTRPPEERDQLREQAARAVDESTAGTPLAGAGDILRPGPEPLPESVTNPPTEPGTLAGQTIRGTVAGADVPKGDGAPSGTGKNAQGASPAADTPGLMPKATEDSRLPGGLIDDVAEFVVSRYKPGANGGRLNLTAQNLNQRYGVRMTNASGGGRQSFLRYVLHPSMVRALYSMYADRFLASLSQAAARHSLSADQGRQMHTALAGRLLSIAAGIDGVLSAPSLGKLQADAESKAKKAESLGAQLAAATFELDQLKEGDASRSSVETAEMRVSGLNARYLRALEESAAAERAMAAAIRKGANQGLDDETLLFIASWVQRRQANGLADARASLEAAMRAMRDLAGRCARIGEGRAAPVGQAPPANPKPPSSAPAEQPSMKPAAERQSVPAPRPSEAVPAPVQAAPHNPPLPERNQTPPAPERPVPVPVGVPQAIPAPVQLDEPAQ